MVRECESWTIEEERLERFGIKEAGKSKIYRRFFRLGHLESNPKTPVGAGRAADRSSFWCLFHAGNLLQPLSVCILNVLCTRS